MSKYPLLEQALARGDDITLMLEDDNVPTYNLNGSFFDDDGVLMVQGGVELYAEFIKADNNRDVVWKMVWEQAWGSKHRVIGVKQ